MIKQKIVRIRSSIFMNWDDKMKAKHKLEEYLDEGWLIKIAIPITDRGSTEEILYILEKEEVELK